jgi:protein-disulfide isomerase
VVRGGFRAAFGVVAGACEGRLREIIEIVLTVVRPIRSLVLTLSLAALGCHAQTGVPAGLPAGTKLSPELARRVEVMIRSRSGVPPQYSILIGDRSKSDVPGYDQITVAFSADGNASKPLVFLLSEDGKTLAQFNKFDLSQDPKDKVKAVDRPGRGGPDNAPVEIVGFDDLECPFCAKMHAELFPAILERYKNQVHVVYLDFPLDQHPWAMRAAIDANCLAATTPVGYWNFVDYVHAHAADIGGEQHTLAVANNDLDKLVLEEGGRQKANEGDLKACLAKQDDTKVKASMKQGEALGVDATPALFINGEEVSGWTPIENIYRIIDGALVAAGQTPPPAPVLPTAQPAAVPATKPGN